MKIFHAVLAIVLLAGCPPTAPSKGDATPRNARFQQSCSSSSECSHNSNGCTNCFGGVCSCILPADPTLDAGVDAAPGGTQPGK